MTYRAVCVMHQAVIVDTRCSLELIYGVVESRAMQLCPEAIVLRFGGDNDCIGDFSSISINEHG